MTKILGFIEMKKTEGKVVFVENSDNNSAVVGTSCDKIFLYGDVAKKINADCIGKHLECEYGKGYSGKAFVSNVHIK